MSITVTPLIKSFLVSFSPSQELDISGYKVFGAQTDAADFTPNGDNKGDGNCLEEGTETSYLIPVSAGGRWLIKVAAYDTFGEDVLNYSQPLEVLVAATDPLDQVAPGTPIEITAASGLTGNGVETSAYITLSWTLDEPADFSNYLVRYRVSGQTAWTEVSAVDPTCTIGSLVPGVAYQYQVAAVDRWNNVSDWSELASFSAATDSTAPAAVSDLTATPGFGSVRLSWTDPADSDFAFMEVYRSTTNDTIGATAIEKSAGSGFSDTALTTGTTYYYWTKSVDFSGNRSAFSNGASATTVQLAPEDLATDAAVDFVLSGSIFSFDAGSSTTLRWTSGSVVRDGISYALAAGSLATAHYSYIIATLSGASAALSTSPIGSALPALSANRVIIALTSSAPAVYADTSKNAYLCYVREANSLQIEGAMIRNETVENSKIKSLVASKITSDNLDVNEYIGVNNGQLKLGKIGTGENGILLRNAANTADVFKVSSSGDATLKNVAVDGTVAVGGTVASPNLFLDGTNKRITVNDGTRDRVQMGQLGTGDYGIDIKDPDGNSVVKVSNSAGAAIQNATVGNLVVGPEGITCGTPTSAFKVWEAVDGKTNLLLGDYGNGNTSYMHWDGDSLNLKADVEMGPNSTITWGQISETPEPRGPWSATFGSYIKGDSVLYNNSSYTCMLGHTATVGKEPTNATYWSLLAAAGYDGYNTSTVTIYKRSATAPSLPTTTGTYIFSTAAITGLDNGWTKNIPAGTDDLYAAVATAVSRTDTDNIAAGEWSTPTILSTVGADGANGLNSATVYLFKRTATEATPAKPSGTLTYNFSSSLLSGSLDGWSQSMPATGGNYRWMMTATATSTASTDLILATEWATPALLANDGDLGQLALSSGNILFNPHFTVVAPDGRPAGVKAVYGGTDPSVISYLDSTKTVIRLSNTPDTTVGAAFTAFRVTPGTTYTIRIKVKRNVAAADGFYFRIDELDTDLPSGYTHLIYNGVGESGVTGATRQRYEYSEGAGLTTAWHTFEFLYTPTATAKWAGPHVLNWTDTISDLHIEYCVITNNATVGAPAGTYVGSQRAETLVSDAATAKTNAETALTNANTANTALADIASDAKLTPSEKSFVRKEWDAIYGEYTQLYSQADALAVSRTDYAVKTQAVGTYLNGGTAYEFSATPPSWITDANLSGTTTIVGETFRSTFKAYYDAKIALMNAIAAKAATMATWEKIPGGTGKPADNATVGADASNLKVGVGVNLIANSAFTNGSLSGWTTSAYGAVFSFASNAQDWFPTGGNAAYIQQNAVTDGYAELVSNSFPVIPGERLEYSVYSGTHRAVSSVFLYFYNSAGAIIGYSAVYDNNEVALGGTTLSSFLRIGGIYTVPANTVYARLVLRKNATRYGNDSYGFFTNAFCGRAHAGQTELSPWAPGPDSIGGLGYTGALDATVGAPAGTYVGSQLAETLVSDAAAAKSNAATAITTLTDIASDAKLTPSEKAFVRREFDAIKSEYPQMFAQADPMGVDRSAYAYAVQYLGDYLNAGVPYPFGADPPSWITDANLSVTTDIVGATFRSKFKDYYDAKIALMNAIAAKAATMATWASVGGANRPKDNAGNVLDTRNDNQPPSWYAIGTTDEFKLCAAIGVTDPATYGALQTVKPWVDTSGGAATQYFLTATRSYKRTGGCGDAAWGAWVLDLDRNSYTGDLNADVTSAVMTSKGIPLNTATGGFSMGNDAFIKTAGKAVDGTGTGLLYGTNSAGKTIFNVGTGGHGSATPHISWNETLAELEIRGKLHATDIMATNFVAQTANIGSAQVNTLQIAGNAVTVPWSNYTTGSFSSNWNMLRTVLASITIDAYLANKPLLIFSSFNITIASASTVTAAGMYAALIDSFDASTKYMTEFIRCNFVPHLSGYKQSAGSLFGVCTAGLPAGTYYLWCGAHFVNSAGTLTNVAGDAIICGTVFGGKR